MKDYKRINNITGWVVFAIAAFTYLKTIEPTASLWDCGEFIASAFWWQKKTEGVRNPSGFKSAVRKRIAAQSNNAKIG